MVSLSWLKGLIAHRRGRLLATAVGVAVIDVLMLSASHTGAALVVSTHDPSVAERLSEQWELRDGRLLTAPKEHVTWSR